MCGRARCTLRADDIPRACRINNGVSRTLQMDRYQQRFNVSPGSYLPVIRRDDGTDGKGAVLHCMKWGLIPSFTKKTEKPDHYKMFNARSESMYEKASFRRLIPNNRCILAVEGFYEWKKDGSKKQPYYIYFKNDQPLVFAALYDSWTNSEGEILYTFTILTTSSSSALQWLHDRMPVILGTESSINEWLNGSSSSKFNNILKPYEDSDLVWYPVTPAMGKLSFDGPECIKEIKLKDEKSLISKFFSKKSENDQGLNPPKIKIDCENTDSAPASPTKDLKQVEKTAEFLDSKEDNESSELEVSSHFKEEGKNFGIKRDHETLELDSKPNTNSTAKLSTNVLKKKKGNLKNAGDNQPTLFSYFGKS